MTLFSEQVILPECKDGAFLEERLISALVLTSPPALLKLLTNVHTIQEQTQQLNWKLNNLRIQSLLAPLSHS